MFSNLFHLLKTRYTQLGGLRLVREYGWMRLVSRVCLHKLTYMPDKVPAKVEGTYYEFVINDKR